MARKSAPHAAIAKILDFLAPGPATPGRGRAWGQSLSDYDPDAVARAMTRLSGLYCESGPYPCDVQGLDSIPDAPVLVVSNHSGGLLIPDAWGLCFVWHRHYRLQRPLHGLGHEMLFKVRGTGEPLARLGALRAGPRVAIEALRDWRRDVAVMPGGDSDVFRPYGDRFRVGFSGRKGYAKLALQSGAAIVPVVNSGAHETLIVLARGARIARATGLRKATRSEVFPISLSVPWGLTIGPWPNLPVPARFRYRFGAPIQLEGDAIEAPSRAQVEELDRRVRTAMQSLLDGLREETPSIGTRLRHGLRL